jgi:hypothetical protein
MATTIEVPVDELVERKRATSGVAESVGDYRTLCVGILYVITIIAVLAFVARL